MTESEDVRHLRADATALLRENSAGTYTKPSTGLYPHQWNWDSALIALGLAHTDLPRAQLEISSLLSAQWDNGMVPHIVFHDPTLAYFPDASFWLTDGHHRPGLASSGITQPPLVATIVRTMDERYDIEPFVREVYPKLVKWHRWFHTTRDADGSGLTASLHPWESGTDDSPRWLDVLASFDPKDVPAFRRVDNVVADAAHRPTDKDYARFVHLVDMQRRNHWDPAAALAQSPFCVQDVLMNSILLRADEDLICLGKRIGADTTEIEALRSKALASFHQRFWNEERGLFLDRDLRNDRSITVNTAATFLPMWAGIATDEQAERLVAHLRNPEEYWVEPGDGYMVTSAARNEAAWNPVRYWRGPVWVLVNWFLHGGLLRHGYNAEAERICDDTVELLRRGGFVEYYDAQNGEGCGGRSFSWSAALALELLPA